MEASQARRGTPQQILCELRRRRPRKRPLLPPKRLRLRLPDRPVKPLGTKINDTSSDLSLLDSKNQKQDNYGVTNIISNFSDFCARFCHTCPT